MKSLLTILTLMFTVMFSSTSFAEWTKIGDNTSGNTIYVDFERIRKHDGYVYWWDLTDFLKPTEYGRLSAKRYSQGDCKLFRYKTLSFAFHDQPMGRDVGTSFSPENPEWGYPSPDSAHEYILKSVCNW